VTLTLAANQALCDGVAPDQRTRGEFPYFCEPYTHDEQHGRIACGTACDKVTSRTRNSLLGMATINQAEAASFFLTPDRS
jgi:hypothetical protein